LDSTISLTRALAYRNSVSLKRTKSLMKENAYCDTKYCWK
jgi:hypothetical protein